MKNPVPDRQPRGRGNVATNFSEHVNPIPDLAAFAEPAAEPADEPVEEDDPADGD